MPTSSEMTSIAFEGVWKEYPRGGGRRSLREELTSLFRTPPQVGQSRFWALNDISFEAKRGEAVGLIGPNGAGKTTILRLLAGVTRPTRGRIEVKGKVASLIELGAGFHPELTGRENAYLNGAVLGLTRREVRRKLDDIVEFAELADAIDVPVKRYSSGMYVRLGFAVAAHADADILLMDEVLSVGDARFQQRSLRKMRALVEQGVTVVLVSHNLSTIGLFCQEALCLSSGKITARGDATAVISAYVNQYSSLEADQTAAIPHAGADPVVFQRVRLFNRRQEETHVFRYRDDLCLRIHYRCEGSLPSPAFTLTIRGPEGRIFQASMLLDGKRPGVIEGAGAIECLFRDLPLVPGSYHVVGSVRGEDGLSYTMHPQVVASFSVEGDPDAYGWEDPRATAFLPEAAPVVIPYEWRVVASPEACG